MSDDNYLKRFESADQLDTNEAFAAGVISVFEAMSQLNWDVPYSHLVDKLGINRDSPASKYIDEVLQ
jgi:hypothetical protein